MDNTGIFFGNNRTAILDMEGISKTLPARPYREKPLSADEIRAYPWSVWGDDNLMPQRMVDDIEKTSSLRGIVALKSRLALCEGLVPAIVKSDETGHRVIDKIVDDDEITEFLEASDHFNQTAAWMNDIIGIGNGACRFMMDNEGKRIAAFRRDDVSEMRYEKRSSSGQINNVYYSAEWDKVFGFEPDDKRVYKLPLLRSWAPWDNLIERADAGARELVMTFRYPSWGKHYYSVPLWYSAKLWVDFAKAMPKIKTNLVNNAMLAQYVVIIYPQFWSAQYPTWDTIQDAEKKEALKLKTFQDIDSKLVGLDKNAYKNIYISGELSIEYGKALQYIEFKPLESNIKDGMMLADSATANSEIAFAEMMNLVLLGGNQSAGPYTKNEGGSNIREGSLFQVIITELERRYIKHVMNVPKKVNGWDKKHKGLEFIIPATALTTLDTGAGSKPVNTGGVQSKDNTNGTDNNNTGS